MHYLNFQSFPSLSSILKLNLKYTEEILKNTKENTGQLDFLFFISYNINIVDVG